MTVSLPKELEAFVRFSVESGRYSNADDVIRDALRHLEDHTEPGWLNREMQEAKESGPADWMTREEWSDIRNRVKNSQG